MGLTKSKILYGVATIAFLDGVTSQLEYTALKDDTFKLTGTENKASRSVECGGELKYDAGCTLALECNIAELDTTDLDAVKAANKVTLNFTNITKTLTIDGAGANVFDYNVEVGIDGLGTKIIFWISASAGIDLDDLFSIV